MKIILLLAMSVLIAPLEAQKTFEFFGLIRSTGIQQIPMSYRLFFIEENGYINGYSITDMAGKDETKNRISGSIDLKNLKLSFHENEIIYTKSKYSEDIFCFINYNGTLRSKNHDFSIQGNFNGLYKDSSTCENGIINMVSINTVNQIIHKTSKNLSKSKKIDPEIKTKLNPNNIFDSIVNSKITKGQNLNIFEQNDYCYLDIWDNDIEDEDKIDVYVNNNLIFESYGIKKEKKIIKIELKNLTTEVKIIAKNIGNTGLNTASLEYRGKNSLLLNTKLNTGESATLTIRKN